MTAPYGHSETFFLPELHWLREHGYAFHIFPVRGRGTLIHTDARRLESSVWGGGLKPREILRALRFLPRLLLLMPVLLRRSGGLVNVLKNCAVIPQALQLAELARRAGDVHIHAYWASTPATVAWLAARLCGAPWSFSAHRGDIRSANLLAEKCRSADFVRCISGGGRKWLCELAGIEPDERVGVMHMGVEIPQQAGGVAPGRSVVRIVCPANLLPVKGHRYLIEACRELLDLGVRNFFVACSGAGPLQASLAARIRDLGVQTVIGITGLADHARLLRSYLAGDVDILALPSATTRDGEYEGIPVALMEAMAHGIPVVTTNCGSIGELVDGHCGLVVPEKDSHALAMALRSLILHEGLRRSVGECGRRRVRQHFDLKITAAAFGLALQRGRPGGIHPAAPTPLCRPILKPAK